MNQFFIAVLGLTAMAFALSNNTRLRKWAPILGLCAQPFWFAFSWQAGAWGLFALCVAYTAVYINGVRVQWFSVGKGCDA